MSGFSPPLSKRKEFLLSLSIAACGLLFEMVVHHFWPHSIDKLAEWNHSFVEDVRKVDGFTLPKVYFSHIAVQVAHGYGGPIPDVVRRFLEPELGIVEGETATPGEVRREPPVIPLSNVDRIAPASWQESLKQVQEQNNLLSPLLNPKDGLGTDRGVQLSPDKDLLNLYTPGWDKKSGSWLDQYQEKYREETPRNWISLLVIIIRLPIVFVFAVIFTLGTLGKFGGVSVFVYLLACLLAALILLWLGDKYIFGTDSHYYQIALYFGLLTPIVAGLLVSVVVLFMLLCAALFGGFLTLANFIGSLSAAPTMIGFCCRAVAKEREHTYISRLVQWMTRV